MHCSNRLVGNICIDSYSRHVDKVRLSDLPWIGKGFQVTPSHVVEVIHHAITILLVGAWVVPPCSRHAIMCTLAVKVVMFGGKHTAQVILSIQWAQNIKKTKNGIRLLMIQQQI